MTKREKVIMAIVCLELVGNVALLLYLYGDIRFGEGRTSKYYELKDILDALNTYVKNKGGA